MQRSIATILSFILFYCLTPILAIAQSPTQSPTQLEDQQVSISKLRCWHEAASASMPQSGGWGATNISPNRWKIEFHIKTLSEKPVTNLYWSFRFVNKDGQTVVQDFKWKHDIKPGKDLLISESFDYRSNLMPESLMGNILIRRIEFADGSAWQPKPDESDPMLIKSPQ